MRGNASYMNKEQIRPWKISGLENDVGYVTEKEVDVAVGKYILEPTKIEYFYYTENLDGTISDLAVRDEYKSEIVNLIVPLTINDKKVVSIKYQGFYGLENLETARFPDAPGETGTITLNGGTFQACKKLKSVYFGTSVGSLGNWDFVNTDKPAEESCTALENIDFSRTIVTVPDFYFAGLNIKNIAFNDSIVSIGRNAFQGCSQLENVALPRSLKTIGERAFMWCTALSHITLPDSLVEAGANLFEGCSSLKHVDFGNGLTEISSAMFSDCIALSHLGIPKNITKVSQWAFCRCTNLKKLFFPETVTVIGTGDNYWEGNIFEGIANVSTVLCVYENSYAYSWATKWGNFVVDVIKDAPLQLAANAITVESKTSNAISIGDIALGNDYNKFYIYGFSYQSSTPSPTTYVDIIPEQNFAISSRHWNGSGYENETTAQITVPLYGGLKVAGSVAHDSIEVDKIHKSVKIIRRFCIKEFAADDAWFEGGNYYVLPVSNSKRDGSFLFTNGVQDKEAKLESGAIQIIRSYFGNKSIAEWKQYAKAQKMKVLYALEEPVIEDITDTDLGASLLKVRAVYPSCYLSLSGQRYASSGLKVEYNRDINAALYELKQAIINLGGSF